MIKEFKAFIMRGNVLDLAVAVIIAGAFGLIISSFVNDILMPPIGLLLGNGDFAELAIILQEEIKNDAGEIIQGFVAIKYGAFLNTIINFLIVAFAIFMAIKAYNKANPPEVEEATPAGPTSEELLAEIRDLLAKRQ